MKKVNDFVGEYGINKEFLCGFKAVHEILSSKFFLYKKASNVRVNDVEGILAYLKSNSPIENCGIQYAMEVVKLLRDELGTDYLFALNLFYHIVSENQSALINNNFNINNEFSELKQFLISEQKKSKINCSVLSKNDIYLMADRMHNFDDSIKDFVRECALKSYEGLQIKIEVVDEKRNFGIVDYYDLRSRVDIIDLETKVFEKPCCVFIKNGLDETTLFNLSEIKDRLQKDILVFYDDCPASLEKSVNSYFSKKDFNFYTFKMGKNFFNDEVFNVLSISGLENDNIFINNSGDDLQKYCKDFVDCNYSKNNLKISLKQKFPTILERMKCLINRLKDSKNRNKIKSKIQELNCRIFKANLNTEDTFRHKGIEEKLHSICHFFKALSDNEKYYSPNLVVPKMYNFLNKRYNESHSMGFYILKQGFYRVLVILFKEKDCDLYSVLENAEKENDRGFKRGNISSDFFEDLEIVPLNYYINSLDIIESSLKGISNTKYIII